MSDDLVARLRHAWDERERQLAEDERVALAAAAKFSFEDEPGSGRWKATMGCGAAVEDQGNSGTVVYDEGAPTEEQADHIARHDPARVLAEVERGRRDLAAKRRILDRYEDMHWHGAAIPHATSPELREPEVGACRTCVTVRLLAEAEGLA